jgi:hypothetical protein
MSEYYNKIYNAVHIESWIILFYQIINNFWYNTAKLKTALTVVEKSFGSTGSISTSSNVYSNN